MSDRVELVAWDGPWDDDDVDANFKADVAAHSKLDAMTTIRTLATNLGIPEGALVRSILGRWAAAGSGALLELGPAMVDRLWEPVARAEADGSDAARLAAYDQLHTMLAWLRLPLDDPSVYPDAG